MKILMFVVVVLALAYCLERSRQPDADGFLIWTVGALVITVFGVGIVFS